MGWRRHHTDLAGYASGEVLLTRAGRRGGAERGRPPHRSVRGGAPAEPRSGTTLSLRVGLGRHRPAEDHSRLSPQRGPPPCCCSIVTSGHQPGPGRTPPVRAQQRRTVRRRVGTSRTSPSPRPRLIAARPAGHGGLQQLATSQAHRRQQGRPRPPVSAVGDTAPAIHQGRPPPDHPQTTQVPAVGNASRLMAPAPTGAAAARP